MRFVLVYRLRKLATDVETDWSDEQTQDERHSPAPLVKLLFRQGSRKHHSDKATHYDRELLAVTLPGCDGRTLVHRSRFEEVCRRRADLATAREALNEPRYDKNDWRCQTDLRISRRDADQTGA